MTQANPLSDISVDAQAELPAARSRLNIGGAIAIVVIMAVVVLLGLGLMRANLSQPTSGAAPDFTLTLYKGYEAGYGSEVTLTQLRGKVVIVNFWASWCLPCRDEAPLLEQTWRKYKDQGVVLVGIGYNDTEPEAIKYMKEFGVTYPNGPDLRNQISPRYHTQGVPETFFVNRDGQITHTEIGPLTQESMNAALLPLLSK